MPSLGHSDVGGSDLTPVVSGFSPERSPGHRDSPLAPAPSDIHGTKWISLARLLVIAFLDIVV